MSVQANRARRRGRMDAAKRFRDQESASREALGLEPISGELAQLYDQLIQGAGQGNPAQGNQARSGLDSLRGTGRGGSGERIVDRISELNATARTDAGLAGTDRPLPESRGIVNSIPGMPFARNRRTNEAVAGVPGLSTALATLKRDASAPTEVNRTGGAESVNFQSGAGSVLEDIDSSRNRLNSILDTVKPMKRQEISGRVDTLLKDVSARESDIRSGQNFRDRLVSDSARAQREVTALNDAIAAGRRRRRGAGVQIPKLALAGASQQRSRLLG